METKPLFVPLKKEYYLQFEAGSKTTEYRLYGPRWNSETCKPGRPVVLSNGYGRSRRLIGEVKAFKGRLLQFLPEEIQNSMKAIYPTANNRTWIACIEIHLLEDVKAL